MNRYYERKHKLRVFDIWMIWVPYKQLYQAFDMRELNTRTKRIKYYYKGKYLVTHGA